MLVNPAKHPHEGRGGQAFVDWLIRRTEQKTIADYKIASEQLLFPDVGYGNGH
jgi:ABC-type tungstate transport system permease subunit